MIKRKGFAMLFWSMFLLIIFAISIWLYLIFSNVLLQEFIPQMDAYINETNNSQTAQVQNVIANTKTSWINWILVLFVGLVVVLAMIAMKKENITDYN